VFEIISPHQFRQLPWKNGKGQTTELAINEGGTVSDFEWRLSIAEVVEDGPFSDFSGYQRTLILIEGNGIELRHDQASVSNLRNILDVATFDGGSETVATLAAGAIKDFNVMARNGKYKVVVNTFAEHRVILPQRTDPGFIYCLAGSAEITSTEHHLTATLPAHHLLKLDASAPRDLRVSGEQMIEIGLTPL